MADLVPIQEVRNGSAAWTETDGAASQTLPYTRSDDKIVLLVRNTDAAPCRIKLKAKGYGVNAQATEDLDVDIAAGAFAVIGPVESMIFKDPDTQTVEAQILDQDDTAFSGTVGNVKMTQLNAPIALVD